MPFAFTMPKLSPTMTEGTIAKWHKKIGEFVESGDLVVEIATDKATIEHFALDPGWLRTIVVAEGECAEVGKPIALFSEEEHQSLEGFSLTPLAVTQPEVAVSKPTITAESPQESSGRIAASPLARKVAARMGVALSSIAGTGPRGRIMSRDVEQANANGIQATANGTQEQTEKLTPMRQAIAKKLQYAKATIPHFYLSVQVEATNLLAFREKLKAAREPITINDCIIQAVARVLMEYPKIRSSFLPEEMAIQHHAHADIAVAVAIPGGLITPIVTAAETKSLKQISIETKALAERAKAGKLQPHEYTGGAFTISNLGMFGVDEFFAIINPPQVAILSVGAILDAPIFKGGGIAPGKILKLTLSVDHRAVDGSDGAAFLKRLKDFLENPSS